MPTAWLTRLPAYAEDGALHAVIEACRGSRNKLKLDPAQGVLRLHKVLPEGACFPYDFGFVPSTLGEDGDPLDVLVLMDESVPPGVVVSCRLIGVIEARQKSRGERARRNDRLLAVAAPSKRHARVRTLADLGDELVAQLERFFVSYNAAQDIEFEPLARRGPREAKRLVAAGMRAFSDAGAS